MNRIIKKAKTLKGEITPPPDKSISHRAVMFASLAKGQSRIKNFLWAKDPLSSLNAMKSLGVEITITDSKEIIVNGKGLHSLKESDNVIDCGNSGTTIRLLSGIVAGQRFLTVLTGDDSLRYRPMKRIINPLSLMGANIMGRAENKFPPIVIKGGFLKGISYEMPIASAQVKSAILLAGLYAKGETTLTEPHKSRDHTEKMLKNMGVNIIINDNTVKLSPVDHELNCFDITIPNDFSSAAFFIAGACLVPDSEILIKQVNLNETRTGFIEVLKNMGATIEIFNITEQGGEPVGDIFAKSSSELKGINVQGDIIPKLIDEFPILCVVATQAEGKTVIKDAKDLRAKESDRIKAMTSELKKMGVKIKEFEDGVEIEGPCKLIGTEVYSYKDHRIAMALSIAGVIAEGETTIKDANCVDISFPEFYSLLEMLQK
ncbi:MULTISPECIES: 3-phosphoshikimate 1-carboxyvinyltransferase [Thermodesulfovibrio]|uniref:3-phosphoshikimate 1-carboxyvinyltransferase n=1 Tax=Thermodesulfovibrio yellowstonii (strain ATCC 51303 / DSM 11347 / YP87) TaxID=289376 RepID=AROA_THEYD|nr:MULTISPECIES: 3-phosphoshikimate 1-carboxyvinyltransferase [Thermodesulfovibrio]B5YH68.1 RecName: Full=3-phosphoshikimate 1-carboxyvinyltransferase; AltName: Full=5-enolpyruvylshikimate-3-phosphate synthase; Short=EPSP synthase; Short=EPSPS [Thermodesulfovibrio yellowstonii DSM 11347]ACI20539.1 3-phosphoshikimate 1-carboxyvinyltransferase [Thermodesulfovibrio yellowstonii DSM 11347]MDI6865575.1 3-phosphoshikimate 1-carboxyvinyltransferase [Thermodesulfovibrio yellowstonii]